MSASRRNSKLPTASAEARTSLCRLSYESENEFIEKHAQNLSRTGIFINTSKPKKVGDTLRFELQLKDGTSILKGKGQVTWNRTSSPSGAPPGMGVKYLQLNDQGKALIKKVMAYKTIHGDRFDRPSRYSMVPLPPTGTTRDEAKRADDAPPEERGQKKKKEMKKIDLNEIDSLLDEIALAKVTTKTRARYRRPAKPIEDTASAPVDDESPKRAGYSPARHAPSIPVPSPTARTSSIPRIDPAPPSEDDPPGLFFDADEFPSDAPVSAKSTGISQDALSNEGSLIDEESDEIQIERISLEEISNIANVEELGPNMEIEADLLEPDVDSEPPVSRGEVALSEEDLASVLDDVYNKEPINAPNNMIQEDELDALLNALEDTEDGAEEDLEVIDDLDVVEIDEDV